MSYLFNLLLIFLLLFFVGVGHASNNVKFNAEEQRYIESHPLIEYGIFPQFYPIETTNGFGEHIGLTRDYIDLIAHATGMRFQLVPSNSGNASFMNLKQRRVALLTSTSAAFADEHGLARSMTFFSTWPVTVTRKTTRSITTADDIDEGYVTITDYLSLIQWFGKRFPGADYRALPSPEKTIQSVVNGQAIAGVVLSPTAAYYMNIVYPGQLKMSRPHMAKIPLVMSARQEDKVLIDIINKVLVSVTPLQQGNIAAKWIVAESQTSAIDSPLRTVLFLITFTVLLLLVVVVYYNRRLKKQIAQQGSRNSLELSVISHELRTPLIGILTASESLLDKLSSSAQRERLANIIHVSRGMLDNLDLSLDYAKITAGSVQQHPQPHLLAELCDTTVRLFTSFAQTHGTTLHVRYHSKQCFLPHLVDSALLGQALNNIVNNAIKHTHGGMVLIECSLLQVDGKNMFCIEVTDTGIGMPENVLKRLAQPFYQGGDDRAIAERHAKGTGLGLFVANKNMQLMGGHLVLTSQKGVGSRVKIVFPVIPAHYAIEKPLPDGLRIKLVPDGCAPLNEVLPIITRLEIPYGDKPENPPATTREPVLSLRFSHGRDLWLLNNQCGRSVALSRPPYASAFYLAVTDLCHEESMVDDVTIAEPASAPDASESGAQRRLLLVEDEPLLLEVQQELFTSIGFQVDTATDAQQAYQRWLQHRHTIIVTDCRLDESNGFELVRHLRKLMQKDTTPALIIGQSAALKAEDSQLAREVGMDYLLQKPISRERWQQLIHDYFTTQVATLV
ncbi:ATP-binding protein [Serratia sp. AKBS12]|nr:ATP-binding protein [Serratia sp. AKBS12]